MKKFNTPNVLRFRVGISKVIELTYFKIQHLYYSFTQIHIYDTTWFLSKYITVINYYVVDI